MSRERGANEEQVSGDENFLDEGTDTGSPPEGGEHEADFEDELEGALDDEGSEGQADDDAQRVLSDRRRRTPERDDRDDELRRLREENERLRQPTHSASAASQEESDGEFQRRVAQLEPIDRLAEQQARSERRHRQSLAFIQAQTADQLDRAAFNSFYANDKRFTKYAAEVERRHQALLRGGPNQPPQLVPRETILKVLIGERVMAPATRDQRRQEERQQRRVDNQRVRPGSNRSDVGSSRDRRNSETDDREARRKRLENLEI